jgi:hypothetical protein
LKNISVIIPQNSDIAFLSPIISEFSLILDQYIQDYPKDIPYSYNERATLSILAGAIWRSSNKNIVFEEYVVKKEKEKESIKYKGRRDIWFRIHDKVKDKIIEFRGEAKQKWGKFDSINIKELLEIARKELKSIDKPKPDDKVIGIVFKVPKATSKEKPDSNLLEKIHNEIASNQLLQIDESVIVLCYENVSLKNDKYPLLLMILLIK